MKVQVTVTQEDIALGVQRNPEACAVAQAIKKQYPHMLVSVDCQVINIEGTYFSPGFAMRRFINDFDESEPVYPCTLTMDEYDSEDYEREV